MYVLIYVEIILECIYMQNVSCEITNKYIMCFTYLVYFGL